MQTDKSNQGGRELEATAAAAGTKQMTSAAGDGTDTRIGDFVSHYRIESRLGAGGMGQVFLAEDVALGRNVALKILPDSFSPALRERLFREAWASARVQHPAIATFYEAGEADGVAFVAMEYVDGWTLKDEIEKGPIPTQRAVTLISRLLESLAHAHSAEILHRDIKPANIMCTKGDGAKLLDFGLARHAEQLDGSSNHSKTELPADAVCEETLEFAPDTSASGSRQLDSLDGLTRHGAILGTLGYMSPEQLSGSAVDVRTDIFAVGAVLHEMLAGQPAFPVPRRVSGCMPRCERRRLESTSAKSRTP